jgi:hypothetical protein
MDESAAKAVISIEIEGLALLAPPAPRIVLDATKIYANHALLSSARKKLSLQMMDVSVNKLLEKITSCI